MKPLDLDCAECLNNGSKNPSPPVTIYGGRLLCETHRQASVHEDQTQKASVARETVLRDK